MLNKNSARLRRACRVRSKFSGHNVVRLGVHRTSKHIYAQLLSAEGGKVLAAASTVEKELRNDKTGNIEAAKKIGTLIAERAKAVGVTQVAFDRSGFRYHGRVKALADSARKSGLEF